MLRALNRLWEPPLGTVFLDSQDICDLDVLTLRGKVGMLFQLPALFEGVLLLSVCYFGSICFGSGSSPFPFEMERLQFMVRFFHGEHQWSKMYHVI